MFRKGFLDVKEEIKESIKALDFFNDNDALDKLESLGNGYSMRYYHYVCSASCRVY